MDRRKEIELFVQVAETGSLSRAADSLELSNAAASRYLDIIDNNIDVAIRTRGVEPDSSITIRRLAETRRILTASPRYVARHGTPKTLDDLHRHKLLIYTHANNPNEMRFNRDGITTTVTVKGVLVANDGQILRVAALDGLGILAQPSYIVYDDIVAGRLAPVLDEWICRA